MSHALRFAPKAVVWMLRLAFCLIWGEMVQKLWQAVLAFIHFQDMNSWYQQFNSWYQQLHFLISTI